MSAVRSWSKAVRASSRSSCWLSVATHSTSASQPPVVLGEPSADLAGVFALDEVGSVLARADPASDDDQPLLDESIHKCGVVLPAVLLADSASVIPRRPWTNVHKK